MSDALISVLAERVARLEDERADVVTLYAYGTALDYGDRVGIGPLHRPAGPRWRSAVAHPVTTLRG